VHQRPPIITVYLLEGTAQAVAQYRGRCINSVLVGYKLPSWKAPSATRSGSSHYADSGCPTDRLPPAGDMLSFPCTERHPGHSLFSPSRLRPPYFLIPPHIVFSLAVPAPAAATVLAAKFLQALLTLSITGLGKSEQRIQTSELADRHTHTAMHRVRLTVFSYSRITTCCLHLQSQLGDVPQ
jgi:hypothetical protein